MSGKSAAPALLAISVLALTLAGCAKQEEIAVWRNKTKAAERIAANGESARRDKQDSGETGDGARDDLPPDDKETPAQVNSVAEDRGDFHFLLRNHENIRREVKLLDNGVETITESDDPEIVRRLQKHVSSMHARIKRGRGLRRWDDLFVAIFKHAAEIKMQIENTENGVRVIETSENPQVVQLIQQHAHVVSGFVSAGFEEARRNHELEKGR